MTILNSYVTNYQRVTVRSQSSDFADGKTWQNSTNKKATLQYSTPLLHGPFLRKMT
jgi:predicted metallo-beta-lactamase superfamily hydrolase